MFVSLLLLILYIVMLNLFYQNKSVIHQYNERNFTLSLSPQATTKQNKGEEIRHAYTNYPHIKKKLKKILRHYIYIIRHYRFVKIKVVIDLLITIY